MHSKRFCVFEAGEMDFFICSKDRGIIILEVKSGNQPRVYNSAQQQLEKAARAVKMKVRKIKISRDQSVSVRYAVVMPNASRQSDNPPSEEGCYEEDLASREAFEYWLNLFMPVLEDPRKLNNEKYDKCLACFLSIILTDYNFNYIHSHLTKTRTPEQAEILEGLNEEAYITGPAGSGKTACLVIKASSEELQYQRKLVVVSNTPLRDHLGKNSLVGVQNNQEKLVDIAIQLVLEDNSAVRYFDSIFIDEAQDFVGNWQLLFDILHNKGEGHYKWIFYDNNQKLRSTPPTQNKSHSEYHLTKVIRNTKKIFDASMEFYSSQKTVKIGHKIVGPEVQIMCFFPQDIENISSNVVQFITESITKLTCCLGVARPGDICVLMENKERAITVGQKVLQMSNGKVVPFQLEQMVEYMDDKRQWPRDLIGDRGNIGVTVDSVSRFKGLESKAVILVIGSRKTRQVIEKMYVGTTRAFCHLTVLYTQNVVRSLRSAELANP
ncbi:uncharacterized protein LOC116293505 [Actinia tenebrosa]|uniref:Uncharacterized protein LOC116293505 n=1 Tax=Actinia tenebrosa TaxID=6105 RepID=A0A6P8HM41_ACTTE|nr:uncharacterized protein LOC116293505 [Actinia tenebrosa]